MVKKPQNLGRGQGESQAGIRKQPQGGAEPLFPKFLGGLTGVLTSVFGIFGDWQKRSCEVHSYKNGSSRAGVFCLLVLVALVHFYLRFGVLGFRLSRPFLFAKHPRAVREGLGIRKKRASFRIENSQSGFVLLRAARSGLLRW